MLIEAPERLIPIGVVAVIVLWWLSARASERRRFARFEEIARAFGAEVVRESDRLLRFQTRIADRDVDVRYQHMRYGWFLVTAMRLANVLDVHSVDVRPRRRPANRSDLDEGTFDRHFAIDDLGYPLREGWLNERMRDALYAFYSTRLPVDKLVIEKATLLHRSALPLRRFDGDTLRELMSRQAEVAAVLERTL
jgi:hypothetical protein